MPSAAAVRRLAVGCVGLLATAAILPAAAAEPPRRLLRAAIAGELTVGPDGVSAAERVTLAPDLAAGLLAAAPGEAIEVAAWPVAAGRREAVRLRRLEVYAPDAQIWVAEDDGLRPAPRSPLEFFLGAASDDPDLRVLATVDPGRGTLNALTLSAQGTHQLRWLGRTRGRREARALVAPLAAWEPADAMAMCDQDLMPEQPRVLASPSSRSARRAAGGPAFLAEPVFSVLHTATIAIDTDNELLLQKFNNNTTSATNYLAALFAGLNLIYERDLVVRLLQGFTILRPSTTADPYSSSTDPSDGLNEFANHWNTNHLGVARAAATMLSGKSPSANSSAGIATVNTLCSNTQGYNFTQVFKFNGSTANHDLFVVGHEIGHNVGSHHTHCYLQAHGLPYPDTCYNSQVGCFSGTRTCPAPATYNGVTNVTGTIMSYCHLSGLSGCGASLVFHPISVDLLDDILAAKVNQCVLPLFQVTSVSPQSGSTAGGTAITVRGAGFDGGAQVRLGGVDATGEVVVDSTTITAVTGAHATGAVTVEVINPGPVTASRSNSYFYYSPPDTDFYTLTPCRVFDTRNANGPWGGPALAPGQNRSFTIAGRCGVPSSAVTVSVNVTVTQPGAAGNIEYFPGNAFAFGTSTLNFAAGQTRANNAVLMLATDGSGTVRFVNVSAGSSHLILDVNGYFAP